MKPPKIQRWIDLLAALLRRQYPVTFDQLIDEVPGYTADQKPESHRRTFERDKLELRKFGVPIETVENFDGEVPGYQLRVRDFYLPYLALRSEAAGGSAHKPRVIDRYGYRSLPTLTFEPDELAAVADAAARVRQLGDPLLAEHAESAMRKLACDLPVDARRGTDGDGGDPHLVPPRARAAPDLLVTLHGALENRKRVTFRYHTMSSDSPGRREAEPFGLFFLNGHWYLARRSRRRKPARFGSGTRRESRAGSPNGRSPLAEDGSLTLEHPLGDVDWAVRHVLQYGPEVTVLEPDEVRQAVVRRLKQMSTS